ncbi:hypothetical protein [uncultured Veillonella sp.]|uniref:hypothetical protein n=1 Tax=uncultured Veillonella sp. TaxID=159268 RepID=UPI0025DE6711|nr:hypothetical protein [uncultured Veillonella sp.]
MISGLLKFLGINSSDSDITKESKMKLEDNRSKSNITKERQNQPVEIEFWDIESEEVPELEESDIPGVYFNEFREYVDEEGNVLSPSEVDALRYKDDYEDDYYR